MRRFAVLGTVLLSMLLLSAPSAFGQGERSSNMELVDTLPYEPRNAAPRRSERTDDVSYSGEATGTCTAHVFRIHEREQLMTAAFYNGGVRVVDLSGLSGISLGSSQLVGEGMKEIGYYRTANADSWSAKTPQINRKTGDFYLFGNDMTRGLDIYRFDGGGTRSKSRGKWMGAEESRVALAGRATPGVAGTTYICLLDN